MTWQIQHYPLTALNQLHSSWVLTSCSISFECKSVSKNKTKQIAECKCVYAAYLFVRKGKGIFDHRILQGDGLLLLLLSCRASQDEVQHRHHHHRNGHHHRERLQEQRSHPELWASWSEKEKRAETGDLQHIKQRVISLNFTCIIDELHTLQVKIKIKIKIKIWLKSCRSSWTEYAGLKKMKWDH